MVKLSKFPDTVARPATGLVKNPEGKEAVAIALNDDEKTMLVMVKGVVFGLVAVPAKVTVVPGAPVLGVFVTDKTSGVA